MEYVFWDFYQMGMKNRKGKAGRRTQKERASRRPELLKDTSWGRNSFLHDQGKNRMVNEGKQI